MGVEQAPPKSVAAEGGRALPGYVQSGTLVPSVLASTCGRCEAHTMHTCGPTEQVKSRANAMKSKAKSCNTACNTRAASGERWLPTCDTVPHGPTRAVSAPVGPERRALRVSDWRVSARVGPSRAVWGRAAEPEPLQLTD